jgi:hypothetical protein
MTLWDKIRRLFGAKPTPVAPRPSTPLPRRTAAPRVQPYPGNATAHAAADARLRAARDERDERDARLRARRERRDDYDDPAVPTMVAFDVDDDSRVDDQAVNQWVGGSDGHPTHSGPPASAYNPPPSDPPAQTYSPPSDPSPPAQTYSPPSSHDSGGSGGHSGGGGGDTGGGGGD